MVMRAIDIDTEFSMTTSRRHSILAFVARWTGAIALLVAGADHLEEYSTNQFSTVPTIGTLFLLNFVAATAVGIGLLLPLRHIVPRLADPLRALLAAAGIGIAFTSLIALWISESSSLFGFTDYGFRAAIVVAIVAEAAALLALTFYVLLAHVRIRHWPRSVPGH